MKTLAHLTLNTGHLRMSPLAEVMDITIRTLDAVVRGGRHTLGEFGGFDVEVSRHQHGASFAVGKGGRSMIIGVVVWDESTAETTWESIVNLYRAQNGEAPPCEMPESIPWLAVQMPVAAMRIGDAEGWAQMGDLERCIAWTILAQEGLA